MFAHRLAADIELRLLQPQDAERLFGVIDANREHLRRWLPWVDGVQTPEDQRAFIREMLHNFADGSDFVLGIWTGGELAGAIGLHQINTYVGTAEIAYWLAEGCQSRGLVTSACRTVLDYAFDTLNLNRVQIRVEPDNERSKAIPKRLGFQYEGTLRRVSRVYERLVDLEVFSILAEEWKGHPSE